MSDVAEMDYQAWHLGYLAPVQSGDEATCTSWNPYD